MDATSGVSSAAATSQNGVYALKKANEIEADSVTQLLNSVATPQSPQYNNPPQLGNKVDIKV